MDPSTHLFWITSRAAGTAALILASVAVAVGLAMGARWRIARGRGRGTDALAIHEALSLATLIAVGIHGLALLGDNYLNASFADIAVPFAGSYRSVWVALGIVGGYGLAALGLSYYFRSQIGQARWRMLHRFTAGFWLLGVVHTLGAGTDAGQAWYLALVATVTLPPLAMLAARLLPAGTDAAQADPAHRPSSGPDPTHQRKDPMYTATSPTQAGRDPSDRRGRSSSPVARPPAPNAPSAAGRVPGSKIAPS